MKAALAIAMAILVAVGGVAGVYLYDHFNVAPAPVSTSSPSCRGPASINSHVYHLDRLQPVKSCTTASGIVDTKTNEDDGGVRIGLNLDPVYINLTSSGNDQQGGDLVVEIICVNSPTQTDAIPACQNYTNQIPIPDLGEHITVTGPYVNDTIHNWMEIHPVYSLVHPSLTTGVSISGYNLNIFYPNGATDGWLGPSRFYPALEPHPIVNGGDIFPDTLNLTNTSSSPQNITSIKVTNPRFSVVSVSPNPTTFGPGETVSVTITIQTPDANYDGPLSIQIVTS